MYVTSTSSKLANSVTLCPPPPVALIVAACPSISTVKLLPNLKVLISALFKVPPSYIT